MARNRRFRRTPPNGVAIYVSADSRLKYLTPRFDTDLVALARDHVTAASVVYGIGANCRGFAFSATAAPPGHGGWGRSLFRRPAAAIGGAQGSHELARGRASNHCVGAGNSPSGAAH